MVTKEELADLVARYVEFMKTPPKTQSECEFHQQVLRNLQGILGAWNAMLKQKRF